MIVVHSPASALHDPDGYFRRGRTVPHPEQAERHGILLEACLTGGHDISDAPDVGLEPILAVHTSGLVELLRTGWGRRDEIPEVGDEVLTGHFARFQMHRRPEGLLGLLGYHMADTSTPLRAGTWDAVYGSAQAALGAADLALRHGSAYALCRPPGHHAYADSAGGFCFLNNTAIAAERLRTAGCRRVAILDIDVHHGNGTQGIFLTRPDVLTVSVHADPANYFPFYARYADETGMDDGAGFNRNIPLPQGTGDAAWLAAIGAGLETLGAFGPDAVVIALGVDASEDDPIGAFKVTTAGFGRAAGLVAELAGPVLLVQEGGYLCPALPRNLGAFLSAFDAARASRA